MLTLRKALSGALAMIGVVGFSINVINAEETSYNIGADYSAFVGSCTDFIDNGTVLKYKGEDQGYCNVKLILGDVDFDIPMIYISDAEGEGYAVIGFASPFGDGLDDRPSSEYIGSLIGNFVKEGYDYRLDITKLYLSFRNSIKKYRDVDSVLIVPQAVNDKPVTTLCDWCFYGMDYVSKVELPSTIKAYDSNVFGGLSSGVTEISIVEDSILHKTISDTSNFKISIGDRLGDVNLDGNVSSHDAILVIRYSIGLERGNYVDGFNIGDCQLKNWYLCDVDYSGEISSTDALLILRKSVDFAI